VQCACKYLQKESSDGLPMKREAVGPPDLRHRTTGVIRDVLPA
jgi:hypothetical protein